MIGDDQRIGAGLRRQPGVFDVHDALEDELAAPLLLDPLDIRP